MAKKKKKRVVKQGQPPASQPELASFEVSLHELEQIVSELESGNLSLSDSLEKYETGIKNLKICHQILEHAENRIRLLTGVDEDGAVTTTEFDAQETEMHQRGEKRTFQRVESTSDGDGHGREIDGDLDGEEDVEDHDDPGSLF